MNIGKNIAQKLRDLLTSCMTHSQIFNLERKNIFTHFLHSQVNMPQYTVVLKKAQYHLLSVVVIVKEEVKPVEIGSQTNDNSI